MESFTVGELNNLIKSVIHNEFKNKLVTVTGEISNLKFSGRHTYLTLKDEDASMSIAFGDHH